MALMGFADGFGPPTDGTSAPSLTLATCFP